MSEVSTKAPDPMDIALGAAVRIRRRTIGMSQEALAEQCGVSFQQIQKYENGANRISFSRLVQIARALKCRVVDLMDVLDGPAFQRARDLHQAREGDAVRAVLVLLDLLEADAALLGERLLRDADGAPANANGGAKSHIHRIGRFCRRVSQFPSPRPFLRAIYSPPRTRTTAL